MMTEAQAKTRFLRLGVVRILGMVLVIFGLQLWLKGAFGTQDETGGKLIAILGIACMFLFPALMRKRWREADKRRRDLGDGNDHGAGPQG
ncbi:MAG: hypothetical protein AAF205_09935 [Pseudomonadota bacterium]